MKAKQKERKKTLAVKEVKTHALNGAVYEKILIESGLKKLGIGGDYEIVITDNPDLVENTAAETLQKFLFKAGLNIKLVPEAKSAGKKRFLLGRDSNLKAIAQFSGSGKLNLRDVPAEDDGFHLKRIGADLVMAGANPRGVLYSVYAFEDFIIAGATGPLDIRTVPYYRKRGSGAAYYHNNYINLMTDDFSEEKAAYLARLGINQLISDDGWGSNTLNALVKSDVFKFQTPPRADLQRKIRAMSAICKKYGIDYYYMLWEPFLPKLAGDLDQYPKEALGKVKRPWGGDKDGLDITLCVNSPIVREHYRNMIEKFVREFPDVRGVLFYNMDGSSWLCTPELCDRCKIVCKDSPQNEHNPWEAQASLVTTLAEAAHKVNPAFDFRLWGTVHYHGERCSKLLHAAEGYASLLSNWNGSDHDIMVADAAVPTSGFLESQKICKERKIPFFALSCFSNLEPVPHSLPFPFHVCDTLKKFKGWGVQCIEEHTGPIPGHNPINALVMKEFQCNPDRNPKEFLSGLSVRQFGKKAGPWMCRAWEEIEKAFDVWNDMPFNPFCGSQFHLSIGGDSFPEPILPDLAEKYNYENAIRIKVEPFKAAEYQKFKEQALLDKMILVNGYLARAVKYAKKAVAAASEKEFIGICYFEGVSGRPTCKEYAELNYASIAIADALCRQRGNRLRAYHLLTEIENTRAGGDEKSAKTKEKLYRELVREDLGVQEGFCELLVGFAKTRPGYTRASLTDRELSDWLSTTLATIKTMKECLDN